MDRKTNMERTNDVSRKLKEEGFTSTEWKMIGGAPRVDAIKIKVLIYTGNIIVSIDIVAFVTRTAAGKRKME